jgi:HlyD family secretion protein
MPDVSTRRTLRRIAAWLGGGAAVALVFAVVFSGLTAGMGPETDESGVAYQTQTVERGALRETVVAAGTMEPLVRVPVISEVSGIILRVHVEAGDRVKRGQPLFELDRERLEARVAERRAELQLREAQGRYDLVGRAEADLAQARRDHARIERLKERDVLAEQELESSQHALRLAEISLNDAHAEAAARAASVAQAGESLRQALRDLENAIVRAPIDGIVIEREGEVGRAVADVTANGGTTIAVIADDRRIRLVAEIDENDIAGVRVGQPADVTIDAFPSERFEGRVRKLGAAGIQTGSISNFEVEIQLDPDPRLRVGMSADARVIVREHQQVLLIPNAAIVRQASETLLRVRDVADGTPSKLAPVELGYSDGFQTVVRNGVGEGDVILVRAEAERG